MINNIFKRSNSVKDNNKLYKKENDLKQIKNINYNELILLFRIKLLAFALQRREIDKEAKKEKKDKINYINENQSLIKE